MLYTAHDISEGQKVFLHNGLMEYGSVLGHGAYLGPDFTADYLRRSSDFVHALLRRRTVRQRRAADGRGLPDQPLRRETGTLRLTAPQAEAHRRLVALLLALLLRAHDQARAAPQGDHRPDRSWHSSRPSSAGRPGSASANRPGHDYSYTNNWPPEPRVENEPTANVVVWSVLSLIALLGGIGVLFAVFGRWGRRLGWHGREQATLSFRAPGDVALTPAQRACAWFFFVMAALFLIQTLVGAASQHYRAEIDSFFGFDLARRVPVQPDAHVARPARALLGRDVVRRRRASSWRR